MRRRILLVCLALSFTLLPSLPSGAQDPGADRNAQWQAAVESAYNRGEVTALESLFAPNYQRLPAKIDAKTVKVGILSLRAAIPDLVAQVSLTLSEGNFLAYRLKLTGTLRNELVFPNSVPIPPTGKPILLVANGIARFDANGRIDSEWLGFDNLGFLVQIGAIPPPQNGQPDVPDFLFKSSSPTDLLRQKETVALHLIASAAGEFSATNERFREDMVANSPFGRLTRELMIGDLTRLRNAMPDLNALLLQMVAESNWVAALYQLRGTFVNTYIGADNIQIPPTNKPFDLVMVVLFEFDPEGKVTAVWELYDSWSFLSQLGLTVPRVPRTP